MQGRREKPAVKIPPFISPFPTWNMYTLTDYLQPFSFPLFPNRRASCKAKSVSLPSSSVCASHRLCHLLLFAPQSLHPKIPLCSATHSPLHSRPLCLNLFGPREQTKKGLCPGRKRWCVTQWGDNASAGSTQSPAPSLLLCLSLSDKLSSIHFHWGT